MLKNKKVFTLTTIVFLVIVVTFLSLILRWNLQKHTPNTLMLKGEEGQIFLELPVQVGDQFSIQFIHSVNKTPVIDFYEIREDHIYVVSTLYYSFGAGVQTEVIEGQTLTYTEDGGMLVSGFNQAIPNLAYVVGKVSDHILEYNNEKFSLREICGSGAYVTFELK